MTQFVYHTLADADDYGKLVFGIIVAIIWGIGALVNAAKKKQKDLQERVQHGENWARIEQEMRQRAAAAQATLSRPPGQGYAPPPPPTYAAPPPLPPQAYAPAPPPPPVFAPTRSIQGPYVPSRPVHRPMPPRMTQRSVQRPFQRPVAIRPAPVMQQQPAQRKSKKQKQVRPQQAPPMPPAEPVVPIAAHAPISTRPAAREAAAADAAALSRWLTPKTLRSQFILTEILQPPLAFREDRNV